MANNVSIALSAGVIAADLRDEDVSKMEDLVSIALSAGVIAARFEERALGQAKACFHRAQRGCDRRPPQLQMAIVFLWSFPSRSARV